MHHVMAEHELKCEVTCLDCCDWAWLHTAWAGDRHAGVKTAASSWSLAEK